MSTLTALVKHAERFTIEGVVDAAIDLSFGLHAVTKLIGELDQLESDPTYCKRFGTFPVTHRISPEERAKRALGIEDEDAA